MAKKTATLDALKRASEPRTETVDLDGFEVVVRELSGRERFSLAELEDVDRWDAMTRVCQMAMIDPSVDDPAALDDLKPEWVIKISNAIMTLSGVTEDAIEEAGNESAPVTAIGGS